MSLQDIVIVICIIVVSIGIGTGIEAPGWLIVSTSILGSMAYALPYILTGSNKRKKKK